MAHPLIVENHKSKHPDAFYVPNPIRIHVGQTVTFKNTDSDPHDVTADDGTFFTGPIASGGTASLRFTRPGTYPYFCTIHPDMHGVIVVTSGS
jgi:plastocyanin